MILAGTGHRPNKLGGYSSYIWNILVETARRSLTHLNPTQVISGMALGWDMALAQAAHELKVPFTAAVPFTGQEGRWPIESQTKYFELLSHAQDIVVVSGGGYSASKMQLRNEWMVDHCDRLLALWNGEQIGGTANCIHYARCQNKPISNAWKLFQRLIQEQRA